MNYLITTTFFLTSSLLCVNVMADDVTQTPSTERLNRGFSYNSPIIKDNYPKPPVKPLPLPVPQVTTGVSPGVPVVGAFFVPLNTFGNNLSGYNYGNYGGSGGSGGFWSGLQNHQPLQQCPLGQFYRCRCENILPRQIDSLEILQQSIQFNHKNEEILNAELSNGLIIHQKTSWKKLPNNQEFQMVQGYYVLKVKEQRYLVIYFDVNEKDYSVQADVKTQPPPTNF
uniref:Uncharacterized protein n=1 Tax=Glossina brevipalpis TaxID=37001 RepID=A0A1A9WGP7_9MUSC